MANDAYYLAKYDRDRIEALLDEKRRGGHTRNLPGQQDDLSQSPDVYIARTPGGGIRALTEHAGTALDDEPGSAECRVFRIDDEFGPGTALSRDMAYIGHDVEVFNLTTTAIPGDTWVLAVRDKFGSWVATTGGGGSSAVIALTPSGGIPMLNIAGGGAGTGTGDWPGGPVTCSIYQIEEMVGTAGDYELNYAGLTLPIFNVGPADIPGDSWVVAVQERGGYWVAIHGTGGSSSIEPDTIVRVDNYVENNPYLYEGRLLTHDPIANTYTVTGDIVFIRELHDRQLCTSSPNNRYHGWKNPTGMSEDDQFSGTGSGTSTTDRDVYLVDNSTPLILDGSTTATLNRAHGVHTVIFDTDATNPDFSLSVGSCSSASIATSGFTGTKQIVRSVTCEDDNLMVIVDTYEFRHGLLKRIT